MVNDHMEKLTDKEQDLQTALRQVTEGGEGSFDWQTEITKRYKKMCGILMIGEMKETAGKSETSQYGLKLFIAVSNNAFSQHKFLKRKFGQNKRGDTLDSVFKKI